MTKVAGSVRLQWRELPPGLRRELPDETLRQLIDDLGAAAAAGMLDDAETTVARTPLELDERGWRKLNRLLARTHEQALAIASESSVRVAEATAQGFPSELAVLYFRRAKTGSPT